MAFIASLEANGPRPEVRSLNKEPQLLEGVPVRRGLLGAIDWIVSLQNPHDHSVMTFHSVVTAQAD